MKLENNNPQDQPSRVAGDALTSARRRLIRGAFAAPAALTLCSGAAIATTSNSRCISNQAATPALPTNIGPADTWLRVPVYAITTAPTEYWVRGSDIVALRGTKVSITSYISTTEFQATFSPFAKQVGAPANLSASAAPGLLAFVRVDTLGNIVGLAGFNTSPNQTAIAQTCWASFKAY